jgi:hypothetical protein
LINAPELLGEHKCCWCPLSNARHFKRLKCGGPAPIVQAPDWVGIAVTVIGLIVALVGLFKD